MGRRDTHMGSPLVVWCHGFGCLIHPFLNVAADLHELIESERFAEHHAVANHWPHSLLVMHRAPRLQEQCADCRSPLGFVVDDEAIDILLRKKNAFVFGDRRRYSAVGDDLDRRSRLCAMAAIMPMTRVPFAAYPSLRTERAQRCFFRRCAPRLMTRGPAVE